MISRETEYKEAGANFRDGFKLISELGKSCATYNAFLLTAFFAGIKTLDFFGDENFSILAQAIIVVVCFAGFCANVAFIVGLERMRGYLILFVEKARDIEMSSNDVQHIPSLFVATDKMGKNKNRLVGTTIVIRMVFSTLMVFWIFCCTYLIYLFYFQFIFES